MPTRYIVLGDLSVLYDISDVDYAVSSEYKRQIDLLLALVYSNNQENWRRFFLVRSLQTSMKAD